MVNNTKRISFDMLLLTLISIVCIASFLLLNEGFIKLVSHWGWEYTQVNINTDGFWRFVLAIGIMGVLPAVLEEIVFRGLLLRLFLRWGTIGAILITSLLFSVYHLNLAQTIYQFILGIILACIVIRTKRLWYAGVLHFINNFVVITYTYIVSEPQTATFNWQTILITFFLAIVGSMFIYVLVKQLSIKGESKHQNAR